MVFIYAGTRPFDQEEFKQASVRYFWDEDLDRAIENIEGHKEAKVGKYPTFCLFDTQEEVQAYSGTISLCAMRTETNVKWTLEQLILELLEEEAYFIERDRLSTRLRSPNQDLLKKDPVYLKSLSMAYTLIQDSKVTVDVLRMVNETLDKIEKK